MANLAEPQNADVLTDSGFCYTLEYAREETHLVDMVVEILSGGNSVEMHVAEALFGLANAVIEINGEENQRDEIASSLRTLGGVLQWLSEPEYRRWVKENLA